ncbi:hypothetical protein FA15DRAFT_667509 [Coprinopsis marcescibilis]|uniref:Uncharacterized protein n=1 Tax=Coprinopsis marcescibilis TaxID=230819 RepID=A0A5C3L0W3_COPMA|nr:hypothetical protein FA15DRAFT_667509 [Coprinopsis marcescibilis]
MPMNTANQHAASAEEYQAQGLIALAAEEHQKAADALLAAIERSNDESAKRTLRLLYNRHCKERDELRRRIQKLQDEGQDPNLPQRADVTPSNKLRQNSHTTHSQPQHTLGLNSAQTYPRPMSDSQNTGDESFMVLGGQRSDPGDAFNQFWNVLQGMLDNIPQPVAFATAPLGTADIPSDASAQLGSQTPPISHVYGGIRRDQNPGHNETQGSDHLLSKLTKRMGITREGSKARPSASKRGVSRSTSGGTVSSSLNDDDFDEDDFIDEGDDLSGSFFLIPSGSEPSSAVLRKENTNLKAELIVMADKLKAAENLLKLRKDQDMQLRNSIFEAQRAMSASGMLPRQTGGDFLNFGKPSPVVVPPLSTGREAQYTKRIKELEDDLRSLRSENEKNKIMIAKFRERWEKLKESAKRKKEAKAAGESGSSDVRGQKIMEEPEAEAELDDSGR